MIEDIKKEIARRVALGESQASIAKKCAVSGAYITQIIQGNTEKMADATIRKIAQALGVNTSSWAILSTRSFEGIQNLCAEAKAYSRMIAAVGETGFGKTTAFKTFERHNPSTFYMLCEVTMTPTQFLKAVCTAIGIDNEGNKGELVKRIAGALVAHEKPLLILDDAGKLGENVFPLIQLLFDKTEGLCGLVLGGTHALQSKMDRARRADRGGFRELYRRIGFWHTVAAPSAKEVTAICAHYGIDSKDVVLLISKKAPDLGTLKEYITNILRISNGQPVTMEMAQAVKIGH